MNIGIVSDSHGDRGSLRALVNAMGPIDVLCFLGDGTDDVRELEAFSGLRAGHPAVYAVKGNNDLYGWEPEEIVLTLGGHKLLMVHGHHQGVRQGLMRLSLYAREKGADVVLFGHTHMPCVENDHGLLMINPGAAGRGMWSVQQPCAAVLCIEEDADMTVKAIRIQAEMG